VTSTAPPLLRLDSAVVVAGAHGGGASAQAA
jgi:hypothetical protein